MIYRVKQGDCISSIAADAGHFWKRVWNDPANTELRRYRSNPNVLLPGDELHIPERELKEVAAGTEERHRFVRKGEPAQVRIIFRQGTLPRDNQEYLLNIDGKLTKGITDANGEIKIRIPGSARRGSIIIGPDHEEFPLELGGLDPIEELTGVRGRLNNLGYDAGALDGVFTEQTATALQRFQKDYGLSESGEVDEQTRAKLKEVHGC